MSKSLDDAGGDFGKTEIYEKHFYLTFILLYFKNGSVIFFVKEKGCNLLKGTTDQSR